MFNRYEIIDGVDVLQMIRYVLSEYNLIDQFTPETLLRGVLQDLFLDQSPTTLATTLIDELDGYVDKDDLDELNDRVKDYILSQTLAIRSKLTASEYINGVTITVGGDIIMSVEDEVVVNEVVSNLATQYEEER